MWRRWGGVGGAMLLLWPPELQEQQEERHEERGQPSQQPHGWGEAVEAMPLGCCCCWSRCLWSGLYGGRVRVS